MIAALVRYRALRWVVTLLAGAAIATGAVFVKDVVGHRFGPDLGLIAYLLTLGLAMVGAGKVAHRVGWLRNQ